MKLQVLIDKVNDLEKEMRTLQLRIANSILIESQQHLTDKHVEEYQTAYHKHQKLLNTDIRKQNK